MLRIAIVAVALAVSLPAAAQAPEVTDVYAVDEHWKADANLYVRGRCRIGEMTPRIRFVDQHWKADLKVYVVDEHWKADLVACEER